MGCDIHLYVEKRIKGKWTAADKWEKDEDDESRLSVSEELYSGRNYHLFSILADVRNGRGFAGVKTGNGFVPIADPRGLPVDVCPEIAKCSEQWGEDGHSHSYFTVAELMAYDWTQHTRLTGVVSGVEFIEWSRYRKGNGQGPESYCGGVSGRDIKHVTLKEMEKAAKDAVDEAEKLPFNEREAKLRELVGNTYTSVEWTEQYFTCASRFLSHTLPVLWRLGKFDEVRIVFWFDN